MDALDPVVIMAVLEALQQAVGQLQGWHYAAIASAFLAGAVYGLRKYQEYRRKPADVLPLVK